MDANKPNKPKNVMHIKLKGVVGWHPVKDVIAPPLDAPNQTNDYLLHSGKRHQSHEIEDMDYRPMQSNLEKAFYQGGAHYPEAADKDGMPHPTDPNLIKTTAKNGRPVWALEPGKAKLVDNSFLRGKNSFIQKTKLSNEALKNYNDLTQMLENDPDRHAIGSGTSIDMPPDHKELRHRHMIGAFMGREGYSIKEGNNGELHIKAPRHSKRANQYNGLDNWIFSQKKLKFLGTTPISDSKGVSNDKPNQRTARNLQSEPGSSGGADISPSVSGSNGDYKQPSQRVSDSVRKRVAQKSDSGPGRPSGTDDSRWVYRVPSTGGNAGEGLPPDDSGAVRGVSVVGGHQRYNPGQSGRGKPALSSQFDALRKNSWAPKGYTIHWQPTDDTRNPKKRAFQIPVDSSKDSITVYAKNPDGHVVARSKIDHVEGKIYPNNTSVHPDHNHVGLVDAMYELAENITGKPMVSEFKKHVGLAKSTSKLLQKGANGNWLEEGYNIKINPAQEYYGRRGNGAHPLSSPSSPSCWLFTVSAHDKNGNKVGQATVGGKDGKLYARDVLVDMPHRRKGIATAMHEIAEMATGGKFVMHEKHLANGKKLWAQPNRPFGKSEVLQKAPLLDNDWHPAIHMGMKPNELHFDTIKTKSGKYHHIFHDPNHDSYYHVLSTSARPSEARGYQAKVYGTSISGNKTAEGHTPIQVDSSMAKEIGKGYGNELYNSVLAYHGHIMSDRYLTPGSHSVYSKLSHHPLVEAHLGGLNDENSQHEIRIDHKNLPSFRSEVWGPGSAPKKNVGEWGDIDPKLNRG